MIIAGSQGLWGAAILCATAAARLGAGYTYLSTEPNFPVGQYPDFLSLPKKAIKYDAVAIGPGLSDSNLIKKWIKKLILEQHSRVVLDAGALDVLSTMEVRIPKTWILTPHEGELARMLKTTSKKVHENRIHYLQLAQDRFQCVILLKGHQTLIADSKNIMKISTGNPALAKAGTGDVLTGMIAALMSQKVPSLHAAACAAYIHGWMADHWLKSGKDQLSLMASDLINLLPAQLKKFR